MRRLTLGAVALALALTACTGPADDGGTPAATPSGPAPGATVSPAPRTGPLTGTGTGADAPVLTVAHDLEVPWGLAFLPGGDALVTLRDRGEVLRLPLDSDAPISLGTVPGVQPDGEGGLLGIAVSPHFDRDRFVFVYLTAREDNRVLRMTLVGERLRPDKVVVSGIPKSGIHNGGRIEFGPDGYLYVGTGDGGDVSRAQDRGSLGGKILRVDLDGHAPKGNPFGDSLIWSLGHRNVQGLAWDDTGRMYASEFGQDTWDELNVIEKGHDYGWPIVEGRSGDKRFTNPLVQWRTSDASPSGIAVGADGAVWMAALRGESLWRIPLRDNAPGRAARPGTPERLLEGAYGRLRTVERSPDGRLWVITSNTFRGVPGRGDDRVLVFPPDGPPR